DSRIGRARPELAVVNCFGDRYPYALCPAQPEVREYLATLAAEAVRDSPATAVSLEACGQLGIVHLGQHEKTEGAWPEPVQRLLSVCCCVGCRGGLRDAGVDPDRAVSQLRAAVAAGSTVDGDLLDALL